MALTDETETYQYWFDRCKKLSNELDAYKEQNRELFNEITKIRQREKELLYNGEKLVKENAEVCDKINKAIVKNAKLQDKINIMKRIVKNLPNKIEVTEFQDKDPKWLYSADEKEKTDKPATAMHDKYLKHDDEKKGKSCSSYEPDIEGIIKRRQEFLNKELEEIAMKNELAALKAFRENILNVVNKPLDFS